MKNLLFLFAISLLCVQCSLFKKDDPKPKLPAATQEGKGTFGCYVNVYPWIPAGRPSTFVPNLELEYDPTFAGGAFDLRAQRVEGDQKGFINIVMFGLSQVGTYSLGFNQSQNQEVFVHLGSNGCRYESRDKQVTATGNLTITRLDLSAGVVAGTFEFTLVKPGCDTVRVTEGRFDMPL